MELRWDGPDLCDFHVVKTLSLICGFVGQHRVENSESTLRTLHCPMCPTDLLWLQPWS